MKVAVFQGLGVHYEMLGYIIEYCFISKIDFHIFIQCNNLDMGWCSWYDKIFKDCGKISWKPISLYNPNDFDVTFLVTDDDSSFLRYTPKNVICINHVNYQRYFGINAYHITTRPHTEKCFTNEWALPCYNVVSCKSKDVDPNGVYHVACVGAFHNCNKDDIIRILKETFEDFEKLHFCIINRNIPYTFSEYQNISCYEASSTQDMMDVISKCQFMFRVSAAFYGYNIAMSASVPLSLTTKTIPILPRSWNNFYALKSAITYDRNSKISLHDVDIVKHFELVHEDLERLVKQRNDVFNKAISSFGFSI